LGLAGEFLPFVFRGKKRNLTDKVFGVTPYGINLDLGADGFTWVYDVTDYKPLFHDTVEISAGNQQELIDLKFMMIEGIPPRDPMDVISVWRGDYGHAAIADDIALPAVDVPLDPSASQYMVRTRTTGHGMSTVENCAEFCPKYHNMSINGSMEFAWLNWTECAANPVYPQGGTWVYDRAGWCPGSFADTYDWEITDLVSPGDTVSVDYGMQMYPAGGGEGNYRITVQLFEYGAPNFINDAAISELISPSNADYYNRQNPVCGMPEIEIKNTGSADLSSLTISYGLEGSLDYTYNWSGNLKFLQKERVKLPPVNWDYLNDNSSRFQVSVSQPNGVADEYPYNNSMLSEFDLTPVYFDDIIVVFRTNSAPQENYWELTDASGNVVYSRSSFAANTLHPDTAILTTGCYTLSLYDTDDDGISWWANNDGSGWMRIRLLNGSYIYTFPADFGKLTSHSFVIDHVTSSDVYPEEGLVNVYPNPSEGIINVNLRLKKQQDVSVSILDIYGRIIYSEQLDDVSYKHLKTDLSDQPDGVYFVKVTGETISVTRKVVLK
ncbi:MAG: T9SS type A sorting domain-containing protein, partial [bacterium]